MSGTSIIAEISMSLMMYFSWLPNNYDLQQAMDSMVGNAYHYGRNWIASKVTAHHSKLLYYIEKKL